MYIVDPQWPARVLPDAHVMKPARTAFGDGALERFAMPKRGCACGCGGKCGEGDQRSYERRRRQRCACTFKAAEP